MPISNPWQRWGIVHTTRDGYPVLSEHAFWQLSGSHPETLERVGPDELYVHLDQPYRAVTITSGYWALFPAPGRKPPTAAPKAPADPGAPS